MAPSTPARADGSAEHSTIASTAPAPARSAGDADVAVDELDARRAQPRQVQLGPAAAQVVERDDLMARGERQRDACADEAGSACDQDPHSPAG